MRYCFLSTSLAIAIFSYARFFPRLTVCSLALQVLVADSEAFARPMAEPWADLLRSLQQKGGYSHVIASSTSFGKNLLPRAAALLDVSPVTDVTAITEERVFVRFDISVAHYDL
jgi:electron transfer flavoprotein alpha subunit